MSQLTTMTDKDYNSLDRKDQEFADRWQKILTYSNGRKSPIFYLKQIREREGNKVNVQVFNKKRKLWGGRFIKNIWCK